MKLVTILILLIIVAVGSLAFLGKQLGMDIIKFEVPALPSFNSVSEFEADITNTTVVHKWQDANGQWHFGSEAPSEMSGAQKIVIYNNQNVVQHYKIETTQEEENEGTDAPPPTAEQTDEEAFDMSATLPSQMLLQLQQQAAQQALQNQLR